jgi:hypothetical protein
MVEGWCYPVTIIFAEMTVLIFGFADESDGWMVHLAVPFGIASIAFQATIVGHFKPYMDGTEEQWGFGQIFAMAALAVIVRKFALDDLCDGCDVQTESREIGSPKGGKNDVRFVG